VILQARTEAEVESLGVGTKVSTPTFPVVVHSVPVDFKPDLPGSESIVHGANCHYIPHLSDRPR
jgi:hypothetical protein